MWKPACALLLLSAAAAAQTGSPDYRSWQDGLRRTAPACVVDIAPGDGRLILVGAATPTVLSDVVFRGRDTEAGAVTLRIEEGAGSLDLAILADDGIVYVVEDPAGRVRQVHLVLPANVVAGVAGLPAARVRMLDLRACRGSSLSGDLGNAALADNRESRERIGAMFGRLPEMVALRTARTATLPAGTLDMPEVGGLLTVYSQGRGATTRTPYVIGSDGRAKRFPSQVFSDREIDPDLLVELDSAPGGLRLIDPVTVVASQPVSQSRRMAPLRK